MARTSRQKRQIVLWILSVIVVMSMICSFIVSLRPGQPRYSATSTPTRFAPPWTVSPTRVEPTLTATPSLAPERAPATSAPPAKRP